MSMPLANVLTSARRFKARYRKVQETKEITENPAASSHFHTTMGRLHRPNFWALTILRQGECEFPGLIERAWHKD
jgi:hypothetical protein